jgi:hypothetical protein
VEPLDGNIHHFQNTYAEDIARYGNNLSYWPKEESRENVFFVSSIPWVTFTNFNMNIAHMKNFFSPMFTFGKYYEQDGKVLLPSRCRSIIRCAMASMWQGCLMSCRRCVMVCRDGEKVMADRQILFKKANVFYLDLRDSGQQCGSEQVWRLMKRVGNKGSGGYRSPRARKGEASIVSPNRLQRQFNPMLRMSVG